MAGRPTLQGMLHCLWFFDVFVPFYTANEATLGNMLAKEMSCRASKSSHLIGSKEFPLPTRGTRSRYSSSAPQLEKQSKEGDAG